MGLGARIPNAVATVFIYEELFDVIPSGVLLYSRHFRDFQQLPSLRTKQIFTSSSHGLRLLSTLLRLHQISNHFEPVVHSSLQPLTSQILGCYWARVPCQNIKAINLKAAGPVGTCRKPCSNPPTWQSLQLFHTNSVTWIDSCNALSSAWNWS